MYKMKNLCPKWRWGQITLFRIRSGHTNTHDHLRRLNKKEKNKTCRYCKKKEETAQHIAMECESFIDKNDYYRRRIR